MSKTDKTKPWRVRVEEHPPWQPVHNHIDGVCNLPESPFKDKRDRLDYGQDCYFRGWTICYKDSCCYGCGCRMCTNYEGRRLARRKSRHDAKAVIRRGDWDSLSRRVKDVW